MKPTQDNVHRAFSASVHRAERDQCCVTAARGCFTGATLLQQSAAAAQQMSDATWSAAAYQYGLNLAPAGAPVVDSDGDSEGLLRKLPADSFLPPGASEPSGCASPPCCGSYTVWDRCESGTTNTECDSLRLNIEAGLLDGPFDERFEAMDLFVRMHYLPLTASILFRRAFALVMENVDVLEWIACCKSTNSAFSDGTYPRFADRLAKLARGRLDSLDVFYLKEGDSPPRIADLRSALVDDAGNLGTQSVAAGYAGYLTPWFADGDPGGRWATYRRILILNGTSVTFNTLLDAWERRASDGDGQRCIELMLGSVIVHELVHCLGVPHLSSEFYDSGASCFVHDRIQGGWLWAMLQRYPDARDSSCCASYTVLSLLYDDQGDAVAASDVRC